MLETNIGQLQASTQNLDPIIPDRPNIRLVTAPFNPGSDPNFFYLTPNGDVAQLAKGLLSNTPGGLLALAGDDFVRGSEDAEAINGNAGSDVLIGGFGNDTLWGGQDSDILYGEQGNDSINGNQGADVVYGGTGNDFIRGGQGNDALVGDSGDDILVGDAGVDRLWGGEGADLFVLRKEAGATSREFGSDRPRPIGTLPSPLDEVPADFILDYNPAQGDVIGLAEGLTRNDIVLSEKFITIGDARLYDSNGPIRPGTPQTLEFRSLDTKATVIREANTGNILGLVKEVSPSQLRFNLVGLDVRTFA
ncbi:MULTISPECIES: calcium-binding protein [unclassified Microcoleus]|uniref:calcium-binding protein n=1 Tax=unclassified Microcoleus TaxID=2642155 RepID=UPI0025DD093A|nr:MULTISPECIES: calcium-binding protein [unclassified Microcoleus]